MADADYRRGLRYATEEELIATLQERTGKQVIILTEQAFSPIGLSYYWDPLEMETRFTLSVNLLETPPVGTTRGPLTNSLRFTTREALTDAELYKLSPAARKRKYAETIIGLFERLGEATSRQLDLIQ
jgi:hypothetical protein